MRIKAFEHIYEYLLNPDAISPWQEGEGDYAQMLYTGVKANFDSLHQRITNVAIAFSAQRIYRVDLAILLVAAYELFFCNLSRGIVCDEAVEIAKIYSTDKSYSYINGILGKLADQPPTVNPTLL
jgi:N utilization substance protein B